MVNIEDTSYPLLDALNTLNFQLQNTTADRTNMDPPLPPRQLDEGHCVVQRAVRRHCGCGREMSTRSSHTCNMS